MKKLIFSAVIALLTVVGFVAYDNYINPANARVCSNNDVVRCGVWTVDEMRNAYNNDASVQNIFAGMGITSDMVNYSTLKEGVVTKNGSSVIVDGVTVADNARSAGRLSSYQGSSWQEHNYGGTVFYSSPTWSSHAMQEMPVYVFFNADGQFQGAVMKHCGNPVSGNNLVPEPKRMEVCRLSDYQYPVTIKESEFNPDEHSTNPADCTPVAACTLLDKPVITNRTNIALSATADAQNGATISGYVFTVVNEAGETVATKTVETTEKTAKTEVEIKDAGNYAVKVVVKTSVGDKAAEACEKQITIEREKMPGVSVDKKVDNVEHKAVGVDTEFTYQIRVTNSGETDLKNVVVTDPAPQGVIFLGVSHGEIKDNGWTYTIASLKQGEHADFTITAKVPTYLAGTIKNTVCVDAPSVPGNPDDCDDATVEVPKFELPQTGAVTDLLNALGLGALTTTTVAYGMSRRRA